MGCQFLVQWIPTQGLNPPSPVSPVLARGFFTTEPPEKPSVYASSEQLEIKIIIYLCTQIPGGSDGKACAYNAGDLGSISGSGRSPGERNGNPLQYSCLENCMDREAWLATVPGVKKNQTRCSNEMTTTK